METHHHHSKKTALQLFTCKCPRCRQGDMFEYSNPYNLKKFMKMNEKCAVCNQVFDIEVGFYYGTSYVSYALTVALSFTTFIAWWLTIGFNLNDNRIFYWLIANSVFLFALQPVFMRLSRTLWLAFFVRYNPKWKQQPAKAPERINAAQMNAW